MADTQCLRCGEPIAPRTDGREKKYCSPRCQKLALNQRSREKKREEHRAARGGVPTECGECGEPIESNKYVVRKFCSDKCRVRSKNRQQRRSRTPIGRPGKRNCARCGVEFNARYSHHIYCSKPCQTARFGVTRTDEIRHCDECAVPFHTSQPSSRWCSKRCANRHWGRVRARRRGSVPQSPYSDREIFERDKWTCHICSAVVDPYVPRTDPMGATIDHLKPIALGGHDTPENVAAAHRKCNIDKMLDEADPATAARVLARVMPNQHD